MPHAAPVDSSSRSGFSWQDSPLSAERADGELSLRPALGPAALGHAVQFVALAFPAVLPSISALLRREAEWPAMARAGSLPELALALAPEAAAAVEPELCEQWMPGAAAVAAERLMLPAAALELLAWVPALPEMRLGVIKDAAAEPVPDPCELWMIGPLAQAVERELIPAASAGLLDGMPMRLPEMLLRAPAANLERIPEPCAEWMPAANPEAAERELLAASAGMAVGSQVRLPEMLLSAQADEYEAVPEPCEQWMPAANPEAAERELLAASAGIAVGSQVRLPEMLLSAQADEYEAVPEPCEQWMPVARAEAVERELLAASAGIAVGSQVRLPEMLLSAQADEHEAIPEPCEQWMPVARAEAAERELNPAASMGIDAGILLRLPEMRLSAQGDEFAEIPEPCERWMGAARPEAAEREAIPAAAAECAIEIRGLLLPRLELAAPAAAAGLAPRSCVECMDAPAPQAAEREVIAAEAARAIEWRTLRLPEMRLAVAVDAEEQIPVSCERWMAPAQSEAAERELKPAMASETLAQQGTHLPEMHLALTPASIEQIPDFFQQQPAAPASGLVATADVQAVPAAAARLPEMRLAPAAIQQIPGFHRQQPAAVGDAVPAMLAQPEPAAIADAPAAITAARLPEMPLAVAAETVESVPDAGERLMPSPAAEAAERQVLPATAEHRAPGAAVNLPAWAFHIVTHVPAEEDWRTAEGPQAAAVAVLPRFRELPIVTLRVPVAELTPIGDVLAKPQPREMAAAADSPLPPPVESRPGLAGFRAEDVPFAPTVLQPVLTLAESVEFAAAFDAGALVGSAAAQAPRIAPASNTGEPADGVPSAGFAPLDFYCETGVRAPVNRADWADSEPKLSLPLFTLRVLPYRGDDIAVEAPSQKPRGSTLRTINRVLSNNLGVLSKIAACLMLISTLFLGARMVRQMHPDRTFSAWAGQDSNSSVPTLTADQATRSNRQPMVTGALSSVRRAIADRAAVEVTDTFETGMPAWGAGPQKWPTGWARDAAGYVRPGAVALFQPSLGYKNYRLEFFGQIETKSMDWMVRAHDAQNYYAMKFKVIEPGLRPVIAMVHYPVVGGRPGHSTETPLNVMIHNSMPYRVAVDVHGNRIVTSIEGQEVDTWVDDTLPSGGVGFFAEAGSRSRLYWMKLYKNDDLLGRICAYLAGNGSGTQTAEVWGPGIPAGPKQPTVPAPRDDAASAVAVLVRVPVGAGRGTNRWREKSWS